VKAATSVTIQLNKRTEGAPDTPGTDILTSSLACDTNGETTTIRFIGHHSCGRPSR
jgi:hypothetical protein